MNRDVLLTIADMERQVKTTESIDRALRSDREVVVDLVTRKVAALRLSISTRTLDRMSKQGLIERVFVGGSVRYRATDIANIVERGI